MASRPNCERCAPWAIVWIVAVTAAGVCFRPVALEAEEKGDALKHEAEFLIRGMLQERERFASGVAIVRGSKATKDGESPEVRGEVVGTYAFEDAFRSFRYDNEEPAYIGVLGKADVGDNSRPLKDVVRAAPRQFFNTRLRYVRNSEYSASWTQSGPGLRSEIQLRAPDAKMGGLVASIAHHLYDVRACGIMDYMDFMSGRFEGGGGRVEQLCATLLELPVVSVSSREGVSTVAFENEHATVTLEVDSAHGFCPRKYKVVSRASPAVQSSEVEWAQIGDVWVPVAFQIQIDVPKIEKHGEYRLEYKWSAVNQPVDRKYFEYTSFTDVLEGVEVVDGRGREPKLLGEFRNGTVVVNEPEVPEQSRLHGRVSPQLIALIGFNVVVLVVIMVCLRRKSRTIPPKSTE